jgi:ABC-type glycerol-3-phosphate transport system substrate-binding protein
MKQLVLIGAAALVLAACGGANEPAPAPEAPATVEEVVEATEEVVTESYDAVEEAVTEGVEAVEEAAAEAVEAIEEAADETAPE